MRFATIVPLAAFVVAATPAAARPILRQADAAVTWVDSLRCTASVAVRVETDAPALVDHRLVAYDGSQIELLRVSGDGVTAGQSQTIGRTESLAVTLPNPGTFSYSLEYRATQREEWAYRCPVWLPAAAADGLSRNVHIVVTLPDGTTPFGTMLPRLTWTTPWRGEATLGHLPAIVRTHFSRPGERLPWTASIDVVRVVDAATVVVLAAASLGWVVRRRR